MLYINLKCGEALDMPIRYPYYPSLCKSCSQPITFETNADDYGGVTLWIAWEEYGEEKIFPIGDAKVPQEDRIDKFYFEVRYDGSCSPIVDEFNISAIVRCQDDFTAIRLDDFRICIAEEKND